MKGTYMKNPGLSPLVRSQFLPPLHHMAATNHKRVNLDPARPPARSLTRPPAHPLTRPPRVGGGRRAESNGRIGRRGDSALPSLARSLPPNYISPANPLSPSPSPLRPPFSSIPQAPNPRCGCALQTASTAGPTSHNHSYPKVSKREQATPFLSLPPSTSTLLTSIGVSIAPQIWSHTNSFQLCKGNETTPFVFAVSWQWWL
jgi:hypothetical protein